VPIGNANPTSAGFGSQNGGMPGPAVETSGLSVSDAIAKACGIPPRNDGSSPSFDFDSASLGGDDRAMLTLVARCLTEGALRGRSVALVGRADPRGEAEYNMNLGGSRANTVQRYLQDLGVGKDKLNATSRGELDATGKDEAGWAKDRRVDVQLAN
jgi:peptidoglycan-associated lipoprotein